MKHLAISLCMILLTQLASAQETRYIRDTLYVPLRSGQSQNHRVVHKGVKSGTRLELLETNEDSGYSRVRTEGGVEGWLQTQYLSEEPTAQRKLESARERIATLEDRLAPLEQKNQALTEREQGLEERIASLTADRKRLKKELDNLREVSGNAVELDRNNKKLIRRNEMLQNEIDVLTAENERLQENTRHNAFIRGAAAVVAGVLLALIVPRLAPRRRRHSEWA